MTPHPSARQEAERIVREANTEYQQECVTTTYRDDEKLVTLIAASLHAAEQRVTERLRPWVEHHVKVCAKYEWNGLRWTLRWGDNSCTCGLDTALRGESGT